MTDFEYEKCKTILDYYKGTHEYAAYLLDKFNNPNNKNITSILEKENIKYQIAELGKVDTGGGGTIAYILANKGIDVIDCGVPVLSMHSPYEVTSKIDLYEAYRAYKAFWLN